MSPKFLAHTVFKNNMENKYHNMLGKASFVYVALEKRNTHSSCHSIILYVALFTLMCCL